MRVWHLTDVRDYRLLTNVSDTANAVSEDSNAVVLSSYKDTFVAKKPEEDYIKVKMTRLGVSSSDISAYLGKQSKYPIVPGRSATALVSESEFPSFKQGQRVLLSPYSVSNNSTKIRGVDIDGYCGDYLYVPIRDIFTLPEGISDEEAVFVEDIALAIKTLVAMDVDKGEYIALYGASHLNCIIAQLCLYYQTIPVIIDTDDERLEQAQIYGVYYTVNPTLESAKQKLIEITGGKMADHLIFDADSFNTIDDLIPFVAQRGKVGLVGYNKHLPPISCNLSKIISQELHILGVADGEGEIHSAINMLANKIVKVNGMTERTCSLEDFPDMIKLISDRTNYKKSVVKLD